MHNSRNSIAISAIYTHIYEFRIQKNKLPKNLYFLFLKFDILILIMEIIYFQKESES